MESWKTLERRTVFDHSRYLRVEEHAVELPDGRIIPDWPWLVTPDFVNVVVETAGSDFLFFRQTKYAVDGLSLAPVGGYLEPGEDALSCAQRELREETGYAAAIWSDLGHFPVDGNRGCGTAHFFLARDARMEGRAASDDLEEQELVRLSATEMREALLAGEFKTLTWVAIVALALLRLEERSP